MLRSMHWRESYLLRADVERRLAEGCAGRVTYCLGGVQSSAEGSGPTLPRGVLERVPTPAAKRKIERGTAIKTYFFVELRSDSDAVRLEFTEGPA